MCQVQVLFTTSLEYVKVADVAVDLGELGVLGMGLDPLEDCPACSNVVRDFLMLGKRQRCYG